MTAFIHQHRTRSGGMRPTFCFAYCASVVDLCYSFVAHFGLSALDHLVKSSCLLPYQASGGHQRALKGCADHLFTIYFSNVMLSIASCVSIHTVIAGRIWQWIAGVSARSPLCLRGCDLDTASSVWCSAIPPAGFFIKETQIEKSFPNLIGIIKIMIFIPQ